MRINKIYRAIFLCLAFILWMHPFQAVAADTDQQIKEMQQTIESLEQKITAIENRRTGTGTSASNEDLVQDVDHILQRLDKVETKSILDKVNIGAELRTRSDFFDFEDNDSTVEDDVDNLISTRFRLNLKADVTDNMRFHARLTSYYNWSDQDVQETKSFTYSRTRSDTTLRVERAFMDYFFESIPVALSMGRLPMTDSLPTNLKENTPRKSIYPAILYDMEMDGMALSFFLDKWLPFLKDPVFRAVYIKSTSEDNDTLLYRDETSYPNSQTVIVGQMEAGLPTAILEDSIIICAVMQIPKMRPLSPAQLTESSGLTFTAVDVPKSLGTLNNYVLYFQSERFLGSWVDIFAGYKFQDCKAEGEVASYLMDHPLYGWIPVTQGVFSDTKNEDTKAYSRHLGFRVNFPIDVLNAPKLGVTYTNGSKNLLAGALATEGIDNMDVVGEAWDFYYIQPVSTNFTIRIGYTTMDVEADPTRWWYGSRPELDQKITNTYVLLDMGF